MNSFVNFLILVLNLCVQLRGTRSDTTVLQECEEEAQGKEWYDDDNCIKYTCISGHVIDSKCPPYMDVEGENCFVNLYPGGSFPNCCAHVICDDNDTTTDYGIVEITTPEEQFETNTAEEHIATSTPEEYLEMSTPDSAIEGSGSGSGSGSGGGEYPDLESGEDDFETTVDDFHFETTKNDDLFEFWTTPTPIEMADKYTTHNPDFYEVSTGKNSDEELIIDLLDDFSDKKFGVEIVKIHKKKPKNKLVEFLHHLAGKKFELEIEIHEEKK